MGPGFAIHASCCFDGGRTGHAVYLLQFHSRRLVVQRSIQFCGRLYGREVLPKMNRPGVMMRWFVVTTILADVVACTRSSDLDPFKIRIKSLCIPVPTHCSGMVQACFPFSSPSFFFSCPSFPTSSIPFFVMIIGLPAESF